MPRVYSAGSRSTGMSGISFLRIGAREGTFPGMLEERSFRVVWDTPGHRTARDFHSSGPTAMSAIAGTGSPWCAPWVPVQKAS